MRLSVAFFCGLFGASLQVALLSPTAAAVYSPQQALPAPTVQGFVSSPADLLADFPDGGAQMIARVRDLAASDPSTLNALIGLLPNANFNQASAIGTGLGQAALMAVKTDQAYANAIQEALAGATSSPGGSNGRSSIGGNDVGSSQPKIGNAVTTKDQVDGVTEKGTLPVTSGSVVYLNELVRTGISGKAELLFADRTNLSVAPVTEIRLDKFVYDPGSGSGNVVLVASSGAFRFITGVQPHQNYEIKTPFATMGVRGTEFIVEITPDGVKIQLISGEVIVTTVSGKVVDVSHPQTVLSVDSQGNTQGPTERSQPLVNFADLGPPVTNITVADALAAFNAVTGGTNIGATGTNGGGGNGGAGGGGGGVGSATAFLGGGSGSFGGAPSLRTFVINTPGNLFTLSLTGGTPATNSVGGPVSQATISP